MLAAIIQNAKNKLTPNGKIITIISNLSEDTINPLLQEKGINAKYIKEKEVPFNVKPILNNQDWMNYLHEKGLKKQKRNGYDYRHTIKILEITKT